MPGARIQSSHFESVVLSADDLYDTFMLGEFVFCFVCTQHVVKLKWGKLKMLSRVQRFYLCLVVATRVQMQDIVILQGENCTMVSPRALRGLYFGT